jgi:hypothetical protein
MLACPVPDFMPADMFSFSYPTPQLLIAMHMLASD